MPAGDLVVSDYQFEIRTTLFGFGTDTNLDADGGLGIRGLGVPDIKTADTPYLHADGSFAGEDYLASRVLSIAFKIVKPTETAAWAALAAASTAWAPSTTDIPLWFQVPGFGKRYVNGRPRGLVENPSLARRGIIPILCTFFCPDPTIHT